MSWTINKTFEFDFGHRVHSQRLNTVLSLDGCLACRHLHGHRGKVRVFLTSEKLDDKGMVLDFKELNWFKKFLDDVIDHKMILDLNDPALKTIYPILQGSDIFLRENLVMNLPEKYFTIYPAIYEQTAIHDREIYEGLVLVDFVPTSENLAKWLFEIVQSKLEGYATVEKIEFWETPKSCSTYSI